MIWLYLGPLLDLQTVLISPLGRLRPLYVDSLTVTAIGLDSARTLRPISVIFTLEQMSVFEYFS